MRELADRLVLDGCIEDGLRLHHVLDLFAFARDTGTVVALVDGHDLLHELRARHAVFSFVLALRGCR